MEHCEPAVGKERADGLCGVRELRGPLGEAGSAFQESSQSCQSSLEGQCYRGPARG